MAGQKLDDYYYNNKLIWKDTYKISDKYTYKKIDKIDGNALLEKDISSLIQNIKPIIKVFNDDIITTSLAVLEYGFNPLILLPANDNYPIKSVKQGVYSTECDFYRCTNLCKVIDEYNYPIHNLDMIYCPEITLFRNNTDYKILEQTYKISLILSTPIKKPSLIYAIQSETMEEQYNNVSDEYSMKNKIDNIFKFALLNNYDCLILTDFGCQQDQNPIKKIIQFFNDSIKKYPIKYVFFAVKPEKDMFSEKNKKDNKNFLLFHELIHR